MPKEKELSPAEQRKISALFLDTPENDNSNNSNSGMTNLSGRNAILLSVLAEQEKNNESGSKEEKKRKHRTEQNNRMLAQVQDNMRKRRNLEVIMKKRSQKNGKNGNIKGIVGHAIGWSILSSVFFT